MTNNDELVLKLKAACDLLKTAEEMYDRQQIMFTDHLSALSKYLKVTRNYDDILTLLAERDADKKRIADMNGTIERECEKSRRMASRIAELEARTVSVKLLDDEDGQPFGFGKWANSKLPATTGAMTISRCEDSWRAALYVFATAAGIKIEVGE